MYISYGSHKAADEGYMTLIQCSRNTKTGLQCKVKLSKPCAYRDYQAKMKVLRMTRLDDDLYWSYLGQRSIYSLYVFDQEQAYRTPQSAAKLFKQFLKRMDIELMDVPYQNSHLGNPRPGESKSINGSMHLSPKPKKRKYVKNKWVEKFKSKSNGQKLKIKFNNRVAKSKSM